jgi:hypothetical protein
MYKVILWRFRAAIVAVETTLHSVCVVLLKVVANCITTLSCTTMLLWRIYVAGNNNSYVRLHVTCHMLQ